MSVADYRQIIIPAVLYRNPKSKHNITPNLTLTLTRNHTIYGIILTPYLTNLSRKHALVCCQSRNVNEPQLSRDYNFRPITIANNTAGISIWRSSVTGIWDYTQCPKTNKLALELGRYIEISATYHRYRYSRYRIGIGVLDIGFIDISKLYR